MRTIYAVRSWDGALVAEHVRIDKPTGGKLMAWRRPGYPSRDGLAGLSTADLPLFGTEHLPGLHPGNTVVLCEGEKAALALLGIGVPAVATVTGASSTPGAVALSVLHAFDVVTWEDRDDPGARHMERCAGSMQQQGMAPRRVIWGRPPKDDAADFVARGGTRVIARGVLAGAQPWPTVRLAPPAPQIRSVARLSLDASRVDNARDCLLNTVMVELGSPVLQRGGSAWWRCPFHSEQTPSFKVDLRSPFYICFGCGARGDVFTFLREMDGLDFKDALRRLSPPTLLGAVAP